LNSDFLPVAQNLRGILDFAIKHSDKQAALIVWDDKSKLAKVLTKAYRACLPNSACVQFEETEGPAIKEHFENLSPGDLVVLIQSSSFRLDSFRIRLELFKRNLKVIEHPHLARIGDLEIPAYLDSLDYDQDYFMRIGHGLKQRIDEAEVGIVCSGGGELVFPSSFESAKINIGDYTDMKNVGGQFPIGEVFTESKDLCAVNGHVSIRFFGDVDFTVNKPKGPITLIVKQGQVSGVINSTPEFDRVLSNIRADEGVIWVRELGFGINRAFSKTRTVSDIGTFERMCGVHLSLGAKHHIYNKPNIKKKRAKHHVDVFVDTDTVTLDDETVFRNEAWLI